MIGRLLCFVGLHRWSPPVPLERPAKASRRLGKAKWGRLCLRDVRHQRHGWLRAAAEKRAAMLRLVRGS
jgi:hypothetical protein